MDFLIVFFYNLILYLIVIIIFPFLVIFTSRNFIVNKFLFKKKFSLNNTIWIHASSVGEVNALKTLILELRKEYVKDEIVLTVMTLTGFNVAQKIDCNIKVYLFPLDLFFVQKKLFKFINPRILILMETEFWPNLLLRAKFNKIPIIIVNGRISNKSFKTYYKTRRFWRIFWSAIKQVLAQSEEDKQSFLKLGFSNVINAKNIKFSQNFPFYENKRENLKLKQEDFVLVWGSSRPGEEELILNIFTELLKKIPELKILLVPRHLKRLSEIKNTIEKCVVGYDYQFYSSLKKEYKILVVDKIGILKMIYSQADLVIVGGSFFSYGAHNPLEPAFYKKPIIIGNDFLSCKDSVYQLQKNKGIIISNKEILFSDIIRIYNDKDLASSLGINAKKTLDKNKDSLKIHIDELRKWLNV